jgi:hypothetical protein
MTDVTVAPEGSAPSAAPSNEVVIEQLPASAPAPITNQAPERSPADQRKEAIQKAFDRANNPQPRTERKPAEARPEPKAADAKPGHNKPPEETEKFDLKKRPVDQPRGERGQFAPREQQDGIQRAAQAAAQRVDTRNAAQPIRQLPEGTPYRDPPPRFSEAGKIDWAATSENVRADIHRMHSEFGKAYQAYRGDHEVMNTIRPFHSMAIEHGTTLDRALHNYVSMEQKLRSDPVGGLDVIVHNLNLADPQTGKRLDLRDIAYHVLSQSPEQLKMIQTSNAQTASAHQIGALHQELAGLKNTLQQMHTQQQFAYTRSAVDLFADSHPRFDELGELIEHELRFGFDLETAYRRAELLRPTTHAAQTRTASAQTRIADKSISGSPSGVAPSNGASRAPGKQVGRREAIQSAINRVNGGSL